MAKSAQNNISVNLLTQDEFSSSQTGKILLWALSVGRYIVVITELIVIMSFLSRFKLDRDLTDLNEAIEKQKAIIQSYGTLETQFRQTQDQLQFIRQNTPIYSADETLAIISKTLPPDVKIDELTLNTQGFSFTSTALSMEGFTQFIQAMFNQNEISDVILGTVDTKDQGLIINFDAEVIYQEEK